MKAKGIRIFDAKDNAINVELVDLLKEIHNGDLLRWSILNFYGSGHLGEGKSILTFEDQVMESERGHFIEWKDLNKLFKKIQLNQIVLIGCYDRNLLHRYEKDQEMYESCDIVIVLIDSNFWEVFSKDLNLIDRLTAKFKEIEFLETNFQDEYNKS